MAHILAIDDDRAILTLIKMTLERDGHQVETATSVAEVSAAKLRFADLILLDVMMPGEDGFSYCGRIRNEVDCPILFVTAKTEEQALVKGLGLGADDYIEKPFTVAGLRARVVAHLRREQRQRTNAFHVGSFCLDIAGKQVLYDNTSLPFTKSEYLLCEHFLQNVNQTFSKEQLAEVVSDGDAIPDGAVIVEHVKNIRAKLKVLGVEPIETVWGIGYKWRKESR